jgi:hypothetical protein
MTALKTFLPPVDFIKMKGEKIAQALSAVI